MRVVVTGAAGFIGSHVVEALAGAGHSVLAVDAPARAACPIAAAHNRAELAARAGLVISDCDLATDDLRTLAAADAVVHLAGRPGVRTSWGAGEAAARRDNVTATARLLKACAARPAGRRPRVVMASSSSVYGSATHPCDEQEPPTPRSPYARSKVEVERLARRAARDGVPTVVLRYFSVYGPRQRPDMAFHRFIEAALDGTAAPVFGDGTQSRAFTYIEDVVRATVLATCAALPAGTVLNVGHPTSVPVREAIDRIAALLGRPLPVTYAAAQTGDVGRTWAAPDRAARLLGWTASTSLDEGLTRQIGWHRERRGG